MSENVIGIRGHVPEAEDDLREAFMRHIGQCYEVYRQRFGEAPNALVAVFGGVKQTALLNYYIPEDGPSGGGVTSMLALAQTTILQDIINPSTS